MVLPYTIVISKTHFQHKVNTLELYTIREAADKINVKDSKVRYLMDRLKVACGPGECVRSEGGSTVLLTDVGLKVIADFIAAENRMYARQPKTYDQIVAEKQKAANAELTKRVMDAIPKQQLQLVQTELANIKLCGDIRTPRYSELKRKESALLKRLGQ